ncbi:MAG: HK97 family phage prohead protease [Pseudooceanicola sp.]|nr:HK97 family phage prohead protease [Pseudooceanicola sp.]
MLHGGFNGTLELRSEGGATRLRGRFPYGTATTLASGRQEQFAARAFAARIDNGADIYLLSGHDFDKPLASRAAGSLDFRDDDDALTFEARIDAGTSWAADFLAAHKAGLIRGLSPGFNVPPGGERVERRGDGILRTVTSADLFEISAVTRPAYPEAQVEARSWETHQDRQPYRGPALRWRA